MHVGLVIVWPNSSDPEHPAKEVIAKEEPDAIVIVLPEVVHVRLPAQAIVSAPVSEFSDMTPDADPPPTVK